MTLLLQTKVRQNEKKKIVNLTSNQGVRASFHLAAQAEVQDANPWSTMAGLDKDVFRFQVSVENPSGVDFHHTLNQLLHDGLIG